MTQATADWRMMTTYLKARAVKRRFESKAAFGRAPEPHPNPSRDL